MGIDAAVGTNAASSPFSLASPLPAGGRGWFVEVAAEKLSHCYSVNIDIAQAMRYLSAVLDKMQFP
jgi:hypothetical protein